MREKAPPTKNLEDWRKLVEKTAGKPPEQFVKKNADQIELELLYYPQNSPPDIWKSRGKDWSQLLSERRNRRDSHPWKVRQDYAEGSLREVSEELKRDGERGVHAVLISTVGANATEWESARQGVQIETAGDWKTLASIAEEKELELWIEGGMFLLSDLIQISTLEPKLRERFRGVFADLFGNIALNGFSPLPLELWLTELRELLGELERENWHPKLICFGGDKYREAGAPPTLELALVLASAIDAMRKFEALGGEPEKLLNYSFFQLGIGGDFFAEIAKLRAFRALWSEVVENSGLDEKYKNLPLFATVSRQIATARDRWNNLLRNVSAGMAAAIGGAEQLALSPFDRTVGAPSSLARRLNATFLRVMLDESKIGEVFDPSAGSWYIESLTEKSFQKSWQLLQTIEAQGGLWNYLSTGKLREKLLQERAKLKEKLSSKELKILGVTEYPPEKEQNPENKPIAEPKLTPPNISPRELPEDFSEKFTALQKMAREGANRLSLWLSLHLKKRAEKTPKIEVFRLEELAETQDNG